MLPHTVVTQYTRFSKIMICQQIIVAVSRCIANPFTINFPELDPIVTFSLYIMATVSPLFFYCLLCVGGGGGLPVFILLLRVLCPPHVCTHWTFCSVCTTAVSLSLFVLHLTSWFSITKWIEFHRLLRTRPSRISNRFHLDPATRMLLLFFSFYFGCGSVAEANETKLPVKLVGSQKCPARQQWVPGHIPVLTQAYSHTQTHTISDWTFSTHVPFKWNSDLYNI